ncbi:MAG: 30S ribosomal protein S15 [Thermoplasmata archaeon]|jgi:small subunit ribosomal protein S15
MARMHAKKKGKSSSTRPYLTENPKWVKPKPKEIEDLVVRFSKEGLSSALVGLRLRDQHGVPSVRLATGKSISQILMENELTPSLPEDLANLMRKAVHLNGHLKTNPKDLHNKRGLHLIEAKIRRITKYYIRTGVMPKDWKYSIETAELQLK